MFHPKRILVAGTSAIAHRIHAELVAAARPVERAEDLQRAASRLPTARTLIIADSATEPFPDCSPDSSPESFLDSGAVVDQVVELCRRRPARHPPLRLILVGSAADANHPPAPPADARLTVETFEPQAQAARSLLARWPLHTGMDPPFGQVPHILFAGFAAPASALLVQCMRLIQYGDQTPVITLADQDPETRRDRVLDAFPQAGRICRLRFTDIDDVDLVDTPPVTSAYVCTTSPEEGLGAARRIAARIAAARGASPLIHLEIGDALASGALKEWDGQLLPFSWLHEVCRPAVLLDGLGDELARVIHEHYRDSIAAQGRDPDAEPAGRSWDRLDSSYRDASRHQSDHLQAKLATLDCRAVREELVECFTFAPLEAEGLAVIEHKRWAADRYLDGWTYAPERDNARKHHPQLIPYDELSAPMKDLDRFAVRLVPTLLARSGRGLSRMLLVAVAEPSEDCRADRQLRRLAGEALQRLTERNPDRSLVLASTLQSGASRLITRLAIDEFETGLFLLCPRPLPETLVGLAADRERHDLLELAARAERRICLAGERELALWTAERAEISLLPGATADASTTAKRVRIDPQTKQLDWSFEY